MIWIAIVQGRRVPKGQRDPTALSCTCPQTDVVLLFYRYFAAVPPLNPHTCLSQNLSPGEAMAKFQHDLCTSLGLKGKIRSVSSRGSLKSNTSNSHFDRVGQEGFNVSLVGSQNATKLYMDACKGHWSFKDLQLDSPDQLDTFFKPTPACLCAFQQLSVKVVDEIVPLLSAPWHPQSVAQGATESLSSPDLHYLEPAAFHNLLLHLPPSAVLLDVRNHYEARVGSFPAALQPPTRRFSELKGWLDAAADQLRPQVVTFCTGGIRCERAGRLISAKTGHDVYTLKGGIEAYLAWARKEVQQGRMAVEDSLFQGQLS